MPLPAQKQKAPNEFGKGVKQNATNKVRIEVLDWYHGEGCENQSKTSRHFKPLNTDNTQWLTTGRNSCPLCRGQGVDEKERDEAELADLPSTSA